MIFFLYKLYNWITKVFYYIYINPLRVIDKTYILEIIWNLSDLNRPQSSIHIEREVPATTVVVNWNLY